MSQLAFIIHWNPEEGGSKASEGMNLSVRARTSRQRGSFPPPAALYELPAGGVARMKAGSSHLKWSGLNVGLPASSILFLKN